MIPQFSFARFDLSQKLCLCGVIIIPHSSIFPRGREKRKSYPAYSALEIGASRRVWFPYMEETLTLAPEFRLHRERVLKTLLGLVEFFSFFTSSANLSVCYVLILLHPIFFNFTILDAILISNISIFSLSTTVSNLALWTLMLISPIYPSPPHEPPTTQPYSNN